MKDNGTFGWLSTSHRKKLVLMIAAILMVCILECVRLGVIMTVKSEYYMQKADELHQRERRIKAKRGRILDRNGEILAANEVVCTVSVIHSQIEDEDKVIKVLAGELDMDVEEVTKKVKKVSSMEYIKTNVAKDIGDAIREYDLPGVKIDEDYKRVYPYNELASKVLGFTGADNQGILGLEAKYDTYLSGTNGQILTLSDAGGIEIKGSREDRILPVDGQDLYTTLDVNIQKYATQLAWETMVKKEAKQVSIIVMRPDNGEILAMANVPEYNLNSPYELNYEPDEEEAQKDKMDLLNNMWRNFCINDTYEPGSIFKTVTATAALETGVVGLNDSFTCSGATVVSDRRIRCHKTTGHGTQDFTHTVYNSCNPAFVEWGRRVGTDNMYLYMGKLGLLAKTGIDLSGEAGTIIHKQENVGAVELATMSFGQSFQITPVQMLRAVSAIVNGGRLVTPHFGLYTGSSDGSVVNEFAYSTQDEAISSQTSETMKKILEGVVSEGGGTKAYIDGYSIGGKTATSQKLPRGSGKYISSFIGFAPADNPQVIAMCLIDEPTGVYYGGTIAAPVVKTLYENILPYIGIERSVQLEKNDD
ncbi:peptidoglycan D,D-transpeptidase FtsI family protein [Lachnospira eligens]|jgi:stage V sporulation protein D (sporulation-specific penicillin-binding protein)|uniref:Peptidoglycan glycosyltransferase n=1 Tax=Lachnospira eligens TaxID=39485 RepID=A0A414DH12_9FIRM|nr:penicillin-binding transpeptidase domain-containing protein [Lachnospira eligens]MBS5257933.1 peptidoglycan glycosyltransferase [Lachnospira eligens]RHD10085.1 peptidoglycan glycosyltransferase [Lachnospira eligens]RHK53117.1 peptidoglycan glycosyltransferase [Lachnospira eligens]HBA10828.1 peptidoglycan glycosyltransferase [Eubacterium sp.]